MKKILFNILLLLLSINIHSQNNEQPHNLDEVIVKGKYAWMEGDKYVFIPQKNEKNLSRNMEDLINRMHTGVLMVEDGQILTRSGQPASVFINGIPADNIDKSTFWAKNALKVEYMEFSDDPQFHGATNIVNFIMKDYVAGGLTKLDGEQQFPNNGSYSAASKLVWGKMTYNALFKGGYSRDHQSGVDITENYEDIYYKNEFYDNVFRQVYAAETKRTNNLYGGFNARYRTDKTVVTHSIALQWDEDPRSVSRGTVEYSPEIINADKMINQSRSHSLSPKLEGLYTFIPSSKWNLSANWVLSHSHNNNFSSYEDLGLNPIVTLSKENIYNIAALLSAMWYCRNNLVFQFSLQENRTTSKTIYNGEVSANQWQNNGNTMVQVLGWWRISNKFVLSVKPQVILYDWNVNHSIKKIEWLPGVNATLAWLINDKHRVNFDSWYYQKNPASSQKNDLILRSTELKWIEGNPKMNSSSNYWLTLAYYTYPNSWFNNILSLNFIANSNEPYISYRAGGNNYDGVIGQYQNATTIRTYLANWSFNINLFDGRIDFGNQLEYRYQKINRKRIGKFRTRPYISWNFGNCSLSANYGTPEKFFAQGGTEVVHTPSYYNIDFSYGNGNFMFDFELSSPFSRYLNTTTVCNNGAYNYNSRTWNNGRSISISLTYTFDYGKKVEPGIEIYDSNIRSTSVLGSN